MTTMKRRLFLKFLAVFALGGLTAACGRKKVPRYPEGSRYPGTYPYNPEKP